MCPPFLPPGTLAGQCLALVLPRMCQLHWAPPQCLQPLCPPHFHPKTWEEPGGATHCQTHVLPAMPGWHPTLPRCRPSLPSLLLCQDTRAARPCPAPHWWVLVMWSTVGWGRGWQSWGPRRGPPASSPPAGEALGMQQGKGVMQPCLVPHGTGQHLRPFSHFSHPLWAHVLGRTPLPPAPSIPPRSLFSVSSHFSSR